MSSVLPVCWLCWLEEEVRKGPEFFSGQVVSETIFLGVYRIGESREVINLTSLKLFQFVCS